EPRVRMSSAGVRPAKVAALSTTSATLVPSGERYAGVGPWMENVATVAPVQPRTRTWLNVLFSHSAPAGVAEPTRMHVPPPSVDLRPAVAGSTTCSSCGPQHVGPPPCVHDGTFARTRLCEPCQPIGP